MFYAQNWRTLMPCSTLAHSCFIARIGAYLSYEKLQLSLFCIPDVSEWRLVFECRSATTYGRTRGSPRATPSPAAARRGLSPMTGWTRCRRPRRRRPPPLRRPRPRTGLRACETTGYNRRARTINARAGFREMHFHLNARARFREMHFHLNARAAGFREMHFHLNARAAGFREMHFHLTHFVRERARMCVCFLEMLQLSECAT